jgi:hypothetical protein
MYYAVFLFEQAGLSGTSSSLLANGIQGVVLNLFTYPNMYYMDKWGRRIPMIIGGIGMGVSMMIIGVLMKAQGIHTCKRTLRIQTDLNRPSCLQLAHTEDRLYICFQCSFTYYHCICVYLCRNIWTDMGMCCLGIPA